MKNAKRILALILALFTLTALICACSKKEVAPIVGSWLYSEVVEDGGERIDFSICFTFAEDGTGIMESGDITRNFTYECKDETLTLTYTTGQERGSRTSFTYRVEGDTLTMQNDAATLVYSRRK